MARSVTYTCDWCGHDIPDAPWLRVPIEKTSEFGVPANPEHLCDECAKRLLLVTNTLAQEIRQENNRWLAGENACAVYYHPHEGQNCRCLKLCKNCGKPKSAHQIALGKPYERSG